MLRGINYQENTNKNYKEITTSYPCRMAINKDRDIARPAGVVEASLHHASLWADTWRNCLLTPENVKCIDISTCHHS